MVCIFCQLDKPPSDEHIIPENVGGCVHSYKVCKECNDLFGREVDSDLIKQRNIYDAFREIPEDERPPLKFVFSKSYLKREDGAELKAPIISTSRKIIPTKMPGDFYVVDPDDKDFIINKIKKVGKQRGYQGEAIQKSIDAYEHFEATSDTGSIHRDPLFNIRVEKHESKTHRVTFMNGDTPHRFLAKACVEMAYLLGINESILNLETLRLHALYGNQLENIRFFQETVPGPRAWPYHLILFAETQFHVQFFTRYATAIEIEWKGAPQNFYFANHIEGKYLLYCEPSGGGLRLTENAVYFRNPDKVIPGAEKKSG